MLKKLLILLLGEIVVLFFVGKSCVGELVTGEVGLGKVPNT